jgi:hypothetical protein
LFFKDKRHQFCDVCVRSDVKEGHKKRKENTCLTNMHTGQFLIKFVKTALLYKIWIHHHIYIELLYMFLERLVYC